MTRYAYRASCTGGRAGHPWSWRPVVALSLACLVVPASVASAHGFGQRFDLPIPLWLWITGAALTVVLSFATVIDFLPAWLERRDPPRLDLLRWTPVRIAMPFLTAILRLAAVALFLLTIIAGVVGDQDPERNIAPVMIWVAFWVGMSLASALFGDLWSAFNPLRTLFRWFEAVHVRRRGYPPRPARSYPAACDRWPAVALLLVFAAMEHVAESGASPRLAASMLLIYAAITFAGMLVYGRETWLRSGELFTVVFGLFARFAPLDIAPAQASPDSNRPRLQLRLPGIGLLDAGGASPSIIALTMVLLATVTFDGLTATWPWRAAIDLLAPEGEGVATALLTAAALLAFPLLFALVLAACCAAMARLAGAGSVSTSRCMAEFVLTLMPIAIAYHLAHYLSLLTISGQLLIPLASDPLGWGWDLFGTRSYIPDIGLIEMRTVWLVTVSAIVAGHVLAVYLGHVQSLHVLPTRATAIRSQGPLLALMVLYTMGSLWILAQPIVG